MYLISKLQVNNSVQGCGGANDQLNIITTSTGSHGCGKGFLWSPTVGDLLQGDGNSSVNISFQEGSGRESERASHIGTEHASGAIKRVINIQLAFIKGYST